MTSMTLCFPPLKCNLIVCPSSLHSFVLGTNFSPIRNPGEIMSFGVSSVNYSDSDSCQNGMRGHCSPYLQGHCINAVSLLHQTMEWIFALPPKQIRVCDGSRWRGCFILEKSTSRQRSGKCAIRKRFPLQKPRWEKTKLTIGYLYIENILYAE